MSEDDPIPPGKIRLQDAYERVFRAVTPEWEGLEAQTEEKLSNRQQTELRADHVDELQDLDEAHVRATRRFQEALSNGELTAYREYPQGERQLSRNDWTARNGYSPGIIPGVFEQPFGRGAVYFDLNEFEKWFEGAFPKRKRGGGRKPSYDWEDIEQFVFKMLDEKGDFDEGWDGWRGQADLHRLICEYRRCRSTEPTSSRDGFFGVAEHPFFAEGDPQKRKIVFRVGAPSTRGRVGTH
jgi:hypothetical protein